MFTYYFGYRWIAFALIAGYGMLRFQLFDFELRVNQAAGLLVAMPVALSAAFLAGGLASPGSQTPTSRGLALAAFMARAVPHTR